MALSEQHRQMLPWFDLVDWHTDPRLAYAKGLADGYAMGHSAANAELVDALAQALGGVGCVDYRQGVQRHLRAVDAKARRDRTDLQARAA